METFTRDSTEFKKKHQILHTVSLLYDLMIFVSIRSLTKCSSTLRISTLISWMVVFKTLFLTVPQFACTENRQKKIKTAAAAAAAWTGTQRRLIRFEYTHMYTHTEREGGWAAVTTGEFQHCTSLPTKKLESSCSLLSHSLTSRCLPAWKSMTAGGVGWLQALMRHCGPSFKDDFY